jgi:hypothetical protein
VAIIFQAGATVTESVWHRSPNAPSVLWTVETATLPDVGEPYYLPDVGLTSTLITGTAVLEYVAVPDGAALTTSVPGLIATWVDSTTYLVTGTPTASGTLTNGLVLSMMGAANSPLNCSVTVRPGPPVNVTLPTVSGTAQEGQTSTSDTGVWTNSPSSYAYQWFTRSGGTGSGTAVTGAFNAAYTYTGADVGKQARCRIRAFNSGGGGSAYQVYTAWSSTIIAAAVAPPVNTVAPSIGTVNGVGETLYCTGDVWTGATGSPTYQWLRNGAAISGATSSSYATTWDDATDTLSCQVTCSNAGGSTVAVSNTTTVYAELKPAYFGTPEWTTTTKHRYIPPNLVNPLELGTTRDDSKPGTGLISKLSQTNWNPSQIDARQDVFGSSILTGTLTTRQVLKLTGGRNVRVAATDMQGAEFDFYSMAGQGFLEGFKINAYGKAPQDLFTIGGTAGPKFYLQDCELTGTRGNNLAETVSKTDLRTNTVAISAAVAISSTQVQITLAGTPLSGTVLGLPGVQQLVIYGSSYRGSNRQNYDLNQNWTIASITGGGGAGSVVTLDCNDSSGRPAYTAGNPGGVNNFDVSTATCVVMGYQQSPQAVRLHPDGIQLDKDKIAGGVYLHRINCGGSYQALGILGNSALSDCEKRLSLISARSDITQNPQDRLTSLVYTGGQLFTPAYLNEFYAVYCDNTSRPYQSINSMVFPGTSITQFGATTTTNSAGANILAYSILNSTTQYKGCAIEGKPADGLHGALAGSFVATAGSNVPGNSYQSRGYGDLRAPIEGDLAADPFVIAPGSSGGGAGSFGISASAASGTECGDIDVTSTLPGNCIVDVFISDASGNMVANTAIKFEGRILKRSTGALSAGTYSFYVTAAVSTVSTSFARVATGIKRTKLISLTVTA